MGNSKLPVTKKTTVARTFSYQKGQCALNFTLRIDVKTELTDFREILTAALSDIDEALKG